MANNQENKNQRKPRYRRAPTDRVRLQGRDIEIIKLVHKHRFLSSAHLAALLPGSSQGLLRRLNLLFHNAYLNRPPEQIRPYRQGSDPMIYGLGNKGADLLANDFGVPRTKVDWTSKNREVKKYYLEHTLLVSDFMVCLEVACRKIGNIKIIGPGEIFAAMPSQPKQPANPWSWKVQVKRESPGGTRQLSFSIIPDKIFGLHFTADPAGRNKAYFFLEADRSTMPIKRASLFKSSYYKKMLGYWASWKEELYQRHFGFKNARILTLAKSQDRIKSMIEACKEVDERGQGSKMILFAQARDFNLTQPERVLAKAWRNGRDDDLMSLTD